MDFYEVIRNRRSIRNYKPDPVPEESLARIAEAVALAPSACNRQPYKFLVIRNQAELDAIRTACPQRLLANAPVIVAALGDASSAWKRPGGESILDVDVGIAMEHLVLAAEAENLATCWVCAYDQAKVDAAVGVEAPWTVVALSPLGYAAAPAGAIMRKKTEDIFQIVD